MSESQLLCHCQDVSTVTIHVTRDARDKWLWLPWQPSDNVTVTSGFRRDVDVICSLLGYYAASSGNSVPTFRDNLSLPSSVLTLEDGTSRLPPNIGIELPLDAEQYPKSAQIPSDNPNYLTSRSNIHFATTDTKLRLKP